MGSAVKRGKDTNRVSAKERPSSRHKSTNKRTVIVLMLIVIGIIALGIIVVCTNLESPKAIKEVKSGIVKMIPALGSCLLISIQPKVVNAIKKSKIARTLCVTIGLACMVWVVCWIKGVMFAEVEEREKKEASTVDILSTNQDVTELSVTLIRNAKTFVWENDIYIEDLSVYYTGESEKISDEQQIAYRCNLLEEYKNNRSESAAQVSQDELSSVNYEKLTQEANEYYQAFEFCNTSGFEDSVKLTNIECSKKARINADSYKKNSENQRLIAVQIIDIGQIEMKSVEETYEPALEWEIKGYGQALVEIKDAEDEEARQAGQEQLQIIEDSIKTSYDNLADSGDDEIAMKARRMQQVMEQK